MTCVYILLQNEEQMSMSSPVDNQFFRMLLEEEGNNLRELLDAEEYLVPQPNHLLRTHDNGVQSTGASRHQSYRVSECSRHTYFGLFRAACVAVTSLNMCYRCNC